MMSAVVLISQAQEEAKPKEGDIKIYKRLIPADVLRGEFEDRKKKRRKSDLESSHVRLWLLSIRKEQKHELRCDFGIYVRPLDSWYFAKVTNNKNKSQFHSIKLNSIVEIVYCMWSNQTENLIYRLLHVNEDEKAS